MYNNQEENMNFSGGNVKNSQPKKSDTYNLDLQVEEILAVLDRNVETPGDAIIEKIMQKKEMVKIATPSGFDFSKYLQIAAVLAAGIFLGVLLGKNANVNSFNKKQVHEDQALMQLSDAYHLFEDYTFGKF